MFKKIGLFLSSLLLLNTQSVLAACSQDINPQIQKIVTDIRKKYNIPGMQVSISCGKDDLRNFVSGTMLIKGKDKVNSEHLFQLGQATLPYISVVLLQLEAEGLLDINDPISQYLPNLPVKWQNITIKQLLNHTSGINSYIDSPKFWQIQSDTNYKKQWSNELLISLVNDEKLEFNPSEGWLFSLTNYTLAGMIIEAVAHHSLEEQLATRIFKPLNLSHTYYQLSFNEGFIQQMAHGYLDFPISWFDQPKDITSQNLTWFPSGAIISTAQDNALFLRALIVEHSLLPEKQQQELMHMVDLSTGQPFDMAARSEGGGYALGILGIKTLDGNEAWYVPGGSLGYSGETWWEKCNDILISSVVNHQDQNESKGAREEELLEKLTELLHANSNNTCKPNSPTLLSTPKSHLNHLLSSAPHQSFRP